ncbi:MAG TPA: PKD domain-containing protein [Dehalococcoidia bacterium]|nr:PKD domain-containing protein [Dehalococcoidia bacterium]
MSRTIRTFALRAATAAAFAVALALPAAGMTHAAPRQIDAQCGGPFAVSAGVPLNIAVPAPFSGVLTYHWEFGDGTTDDHNPTSHVYAAPGSYSLSLRITSSRLDTAGCATTVTVTGGGDTSAPAPVNQIDVESGCRGELSVATGSPLALQAVPPFGGVVTYEWQFGDGATDDHNPTTHVYAAAGVYTVSVQATSGALVTASCETTVYVVDPS